MNFHSKGLVTIQVTTHRTSSRDEARDAVRQSLVQALSSAMPGSSPVLVTVPGRRPSLASPLVDIGLSISHEEGLSLGAINLLGPVGVDLMCPLDGPDLMDVARTYLGPLAASALHKQGTQFRAPQFARFWTRHEARMKCCGLPLVEWHPALAHQLDQCRDESLAMPPGYVAHLAWA